MGQTKQRMLTALVMLTVVGAALFLAPPWLWALLVVALAGVASREWANLCHWPARMVGAFVALMLLLATGLALRAGHDAWLDATLIAAAVLFWALVVPMALRKGWSGRGSLGVAGALVILPLVWALLWLQQQVAGTWLLLSGMAFVWIADSAAYFAGRAFGRHKLAPAISPGKTWEGVAGAVLAVLGYAVVLHSVAGDWLTPGLPGLLLLALLLCALSILGDLYESWMKRVAGVKDSGRLLPGHGGLLDRVDGLAAAMPVWAAGLWLAGLVG